MNGSQNRVGMLSGSGNCGSLDAEDSFALPSHFDSVQDPENRAEFVKRLVRHFNSC